MRKLYLSFLAFANFGYVLKAQINFLVQPSCYNRICSFQGQKDTVFYGETSWMNYEIMVGVEKNDSVKKNRIRFNLGWQLNTLNYSGKFKYEPWDKNYLLLKSKLRQHYLVFNLGYEFYFSRLKKPFSLEPFVNFNFFLKETLTQEVKDIAGSYDVFARGGLGSSNFDYVTVGAKINLNLLESRKLILGGGFFLSHNTNVVRIYYYPRDCNFYSIGLNLLVTIKTKKHEKKH